MDNSLLSQNFSSRNKKLIESGWDTKDAVFIRDHIQDMEATGSFFDGIRFKLQKEEYLAFEKIPLTEKDINLSVLESINWSRFTDNFIQVQGSSQNNDPDWFDNSLWNTIIANTRMLSKALKAGKCKGIIFDPEFYYASTTYSPWIYNKTIFPNKSFDEVQRKVYQRGREFMTALQSEQNEVLVLSFWGLGIALAQKQYYDNDLSRAQYALLPSFFDGLLEAANPDSMIIDGNEGSYWYDETRKFVQGYNYVYEAADKLLTNSGLWNTNGQYGAAIYVDNIYDLWNQQSEDWGQDYADKWLKHNIYHALLTSDKYVWVYSEGGSWNTMLDWWSGIHVPSNARVNITEARELLDKEQPLGYDMVKLTDFWESDAKAAFFNSPAITISSRSNFDSSGKSLDIIVDSVPRSGIDRVEFYLNSKKVAENKTYPYKVTITPIPQSKSLTVFARLFLENDNHITSNVLYIK